MPPLKCDHHSALFFGIYKCALGVQDLKEAASKNIMLGMMFMLMSYLGMSLIQKVISSSSSIYLEPFKFITA